MSTLVLSDARIVTPDRVIDGGWLEITDGQISAIGDGDSPGRSRSLEGAFLLPGFVDLHIHGGGGGSFSEGADGAHTTVNTHRRRGTTTMLASIATAPLADMLQRCRALIPLCEEGELLGIHLEGPFLSAGHRGAHPEDQLLAADLETLDLLIASTSGWLRSVTLAPESEGADALIARLDELGVLVAFGHTSATSDEMTRALTGRRGYVTHLFNGMPPMHHREPGAVVPALLDPRCLVEIINDGIHVHPEMVRTVFSLARGRVVLITDAMAAAGLGDGTYTFDQSTIEVKHGRAWSPSAHSLAGSTLTMLDAFRNTVELGVDMVEASAAASSTAARAMGIDHETGSIAVGRRADLVALDSDLSPLLVFRNGEVLEETAC